MAAVDGGASGARNAAAFSRITENVLWVADGAGAATAIAAGVTARCGAAARAATGRAIIIIGAILAVGRDTVAKLVGRA